MKIPFIDKTLAEQIAAVIPTPFYIYDENGIRENVRKLYRAFSWNKGFKEYFAVKATPNPIILRILNEEGCGCDCSSSNELLLSKAIGCTGREIMFSSNNTPYGEFSLSSQLGAIINLDDISHIQFLEREAGIPEIISLRYNPGGEFALNNAIMSTPSEAKFGMTFNQIISALSYLKERGVKEFGLHMFVASNTLAQDFYPSVAKLLFETAVKIKKITDIRLSFINLSGGLGVPYHPNEAVLDIETIAQKIKDEYYRILEPEEMNDITLYTELGRYMLAPFGALITRVIHKKHTYKEYVGVDASSCNLMRPAMYGAYHHISVLGKEEEAPTGIYDVTGSLCENNDKLAINREFPQTDIGDILFIHDVGAHGFSMGYNYNGRMRSAEVLLKSDGNYELIRRAETSRDYFATFDFLGLDYS